jgi:hypothetical protein
MNDVMIAGTRDQRRSLQQVVVVGKDPLLLSSYSACVVLEEYFAGY